MLPPTRCTTTHNSLLSAVPPLLPLWPPACLQTLMKHVLQIASQYTGGDKEEWQRAAKKFRLPYLDWCAAQGILLWTSCLCSSAAAASAMVHVLPSY